MNRWPALCMHRQHSPTRPARWDVTASSGGHRFGEVCCDTCLPAVRKTAEKIGHPTVTPIQQDDNTVLRTPPGDPQGSLFDGDGDAA